ncbi:polysaccharide biosynthesis protein [Aestuariibacter salexigens]|uniref:polysaccharide biosynthesis protein n=1 Tax=Aestuariibacter salexigens TaxID=226010 RepID=UPI000425AA7B|nr:nucleoside-diphosphate sugar epimerase/dehydratase [Aestuariibacter salexigens]
MMQMSRLYQLPGPIKFAMLLGWDTLALVGAFFMAFLVRLGVDRLPIGFIELMVLLSSVIFTLSILMLMGHYQQMTRYISLNAGVVIVLGVTLSSAYLALCADMVNAFMPLSVPFLYWMFAITGIAGPRFFVYLTAQSQGFKLREKCLIFGANNAGRLLATTLKQGRDLLPVAFVDDKQHYIGKQVLGIPVIGREDIPEVVAKHNVRKMLLAVNNTSVGRRKELLQELEPFALELLSVPDVSEVASGKRKIDELREVRIEELLGRAPVEPLPDLLSCNITGKTVMVTGAGGSIGSELCRQLIKLSPSAVVLFELCEYNLYQIENELSAQYPDIPLIPVLASVQDTEVLRAIIEKHRIQTIYHAAAYKHVPIVEYNVSAGIRNNIFGTANVALIAAEYEVEKFVLVSTDKAVRPTNVMGATKRFAELFVQGIAELNPKTEYAIVRFGNVLGSSGSVVPLFTRQIQAGGPITITHPDIIRYFMTIPEAALLVLQAGAMGKHGEVFVLDMGEPVKIVDLAVKMTHLMGRRVKSEQYPDGDIELVFTGLRPGEKLYEELLIDDADTRTQHPRIMGANETKLEFADVVMYLDQLNFALVNGNEQEARNILLQAPLAYTPRLDKLAS